METLYFKKVRVAMVLVVMTSAVNAQGIIDGFYAANGELSVTVSYTGTSYDEFYVGEEKVGPVPAHEKITQNIVSLYTKYGVTDGLTLILNAPFIAAKGHGEADPFSGEKEESGFQDLSIAAKYKPFGLSFTGGKFEGIASLGFDIPLGYRPSSILAIGNGAFSTDLNMGGHLHLKQGFFTTVVVGYSFRGTSKDSFDVNNGEDFDVPNALTAMAKIGYASSILYSELWFDHQTTSTNGVDIMGPGFNGNFPETRVNYSRIGVSAYVPISQGFGLSAGYGTVIGGRNIGDADYFNIGLTYAINTLGL